LVGILASTACPCEPPFAVPSVGPSSVPENAPDVMGPIFERAPMIGLVRTTPHGVRVGSLRGHLGGRCLGRLPVTRKRPLERKNSSQ
jgi:hypothetical protein